MGGPIAREGGGCFNRPASRPATQPRALTVDEIINKTNYVAYYQGRDGKAKISMTVVDARGQNRLKELIILRWDQKPAEEGLQDEKSPASRPPATQTAAVWTCSMHPQIRLPAAGKCPICGMDLIAAPHTPPKAPDTDRTDLGRGNREHPAGAAADRIDMSHCDEQKFYVYFQSPPDDNKTTFLVWKHFDKDDDRWLYLPNLDLVKRIAATDKRTSFVGSHFFYEDVSGRNINADKHELLKTTDIYYVLRNTPKKPESAEFAYYDMYILKDTFVPVHIWYFDKNDKKYRTYSVLKWDRDRKFGYATVHKARMTDSNIGGYTDLEYKDVRYNIGLPENLFTERFLKRTPYRYLE